MRTIISAFKNKYIVLAMAFMALFAMGFWMNDKTARSADCPTQGPTSPTFNYWPLSYSGGLECTDFPLVDARNLSSSGSRDNRYAQSQSEHDSGITANTGDEVRVRVYFHNGASDQIDRAQTTARNVRVSASLPTTATTNSLINASISADNAPTITSSSQYGGPARVNTSGLSTLSYIPGSTKMCILYDAAVERGINANTAQTCGTALDGRPQILIDLPDGITTGGVNIGDLKSCFPYAGSVVFSVRVNAGSAGNASMSITKQVSNFTTGTGYSSSVSARSGDQVGYRVTVTNTGSITLLNARVNDAAPAGISFNNNTFPISIGSLAPGQSSTVSYTGTVNASSGTLVNTATASADNAPSVSASATVIVSTISGGGSAFLNIDKLVRNSSTGTSYQDSVSASSGQTVQFQITVRNSGSVTANNVYLRDFLPSGLSLVSGTVRLDGSFSSDNLVSNNLYLGNMFSGQQRIITFDATVQSFASGSMQNVAQASSDNTGTVSDSAYVTVTVGQVAGANLVLSKRVLNETRSTSGTSLTASRDEYLTYSLRVTNNSGSYATYTISDDISDILRYATIVNLNGGTLNGNTISWPQVSIAPYSFEQRTFRVRVNYFLPAGNLTMTNVFGDTVTVRIQSPQVLGTFVAPKTGAGTWTGIAFAAAATIAYALIRKKNLVAKTLKIKN